MLPKNIYLYVRVREAGPADITRTMVSSWIDLRLQISRPVARSLIVIVNLFYCTTLSQKQKTKY